MAVGVARRFRGSGWLVGLSVLALTVSLLPAVEMPRPHAVPGTPAALAGPGPVALPLPAEARPNTLPAKRAPVVPPGIPAAGAPRALSPAELARLPRPAPPERPGAPLPSQLGGPRAQDGGPGEPVFEDVLLRPGYVLGDTSLLVYFNLHNDDRSFTSWVVTLFDKASGTAQVSTTLTTAELEPKCEAVRTFCKSFGSAQNWVLDPARTYFVTITAVFDDGRKVESAPSPEGKPRTTIVPPPVSRAQAAIESLKRERTSASIRPGSAAPG